MPSLKHNLEALGLLALFKLFKLLPLDIASWTGGAIARSIGPALGAHQVAKDNLAATFPEMDARARQRILSGMWWNLGRVAAELPYLPENRLHERVTVKGLEHLPTKGEPCVFFSGHLGNWELTYPQALRRGLEVTLVYRHANNPVVERMIRALRATQSSHQIAKGMGSGIPLIRALKERNCIAMLIDQKMNDGIAVPFFGRKAMTAPAIAELALRFGLPIYPARCVRTRGCHFEVTVSPPLVYAKTGNKEKDVQAIMRSIHSILEGWIREHPEQWFWVHRRWPKKPI